MKLKHKYQFMLLIVMISVPLSLLLANFVMLGIYRLVYKGKSSSVPFHESFAYPGMIVLFMLALVSLIFLFSRSIHSLLIKIGLLDQTIRELAANKQVPEKVTVEREDELGSLVHSVNALIERTSWRELALEQEMNIRKEMIRKLRHDFNTPLTTMKLQLFYLEEAEEHSKQEIIHAMNQQIEHMARLTDDLSMMSVNTLEYVIKEDVDVELVLQNTISKWNYLFHQSKMELLYKSDGKPFSWMGNQLLFQRILDNVLQNILKHAEATKTTISVQNFVVTIEDNGVGFDCTNDHKGLGLKIIADITQLLKVKYFLRSDPLGTTFTFQLEETNKGQT